MDKQTTDVKALQKELDTLKASHSDLQGKYSQLEEQYNTYKFDIEFKDDIKGIEAKIQDKDMNTLKELKKSGNSDAYQLLLDRYKVNNSCYTTTDKYGRTVPTKYVPGDGQISNSSDIDLFSNAINDIKGGK